MPLHWVTMVFLYLLLSASSSCRARTSTFVVTSTRRYRRCLRPSNSRPLAFCHFSTSSDNSNDVDNTDNNTVSKNDATTKKTAIVVDEQSSSSSSLQILAHNLSQGKYKNVVVLVGAGASVSAGIPDFRTPGTGLYDQLQKYNLPYPEAMFDVDYYRQTPQAFVDLCSAIWPGQKEGPKPTLTHAFFRLLQSKFDCLLRIYTQNIDGLEELVGVTADKLLECHGTFRTASCVDCQTSYPIDVCREFMVRKAKASAPRCEKCGGCIKPDIVFFGEEMPTRFQDCIAADMDACDLLLVFGTSLLVMPVAGIPSWISKDCPRVLFNRELVGSFVYSQSEEEGNGRDIILLGDCDDQVLRLAKEAGCDAELNKIYQKAKK